MSALHSQANWKLVFIVQYYCSRVSTMVTMCCKELQEYIILDIRGYHTSACLRAEGSVRTYRSLRGRIILEFSEVQTEARRCWKKPNTDQVPSSQRRLDTYLDDFKFIRTFRDRMRR